jgi:poly-gamma-glutamate capsule biosynthesis protein CapA/YwtB (metallophosphatase superfamily)
MRIPALALSLLLLAAPSAFAAGTESLTVKLVGQSLIKKDLRSFAPAAVEQASEYLAADVVFTNLEVAVAPRGAAVTLRTPDVTQVEPDVLDNLKEMGFNLLALSNNHALDLGIPGLLATMEEARKRGFGYAGTGRNADEAAAAGILETPKGRVALLGIASGAVQLVPDTWATPDRAGVNFLELRADGSLNPEQHARIVAAVRAARRDSDLVIVYHHNHYWGGQRGSGLPPGRDRRIDRFVTPAWMEGLARELVDAGADIFVAHGNPALHGIEIYRGKAILYGLGNYIFQAAATIDRYGPLAYYSAVVECRFSHGRLTGIDIRPLVLSLDQTETQPRGTPYLAEGGEADVVLSRIANESLRYGTEIRIDGGRAAVVLP